MASGRRIERIVLDILGIVVHIFLNVIFYIAIVYMVIKASRYAYTFSYQVFGSVSVTKGTGYDKDFIIEKGESTMNVAGNLQREGLIVDKYSFYRRAKISNRKILPGKYKLNTSMNYDGILDLITGTATEGNGGTK